MFSCIRCLLIFSAAGFLIPHTLSARITEHHSDYKDEDKNESSQLTHEDDHMKLEMKPHNINEDHDNEFSLDNDASYQVISNAIKDEKEEVFGDDENEKRSTNGPCSQMPCVSDNEECDDNGGKTEGSCICKLGYTRDSQNNCRFSLISHNTTILRIASIGQCKSSENKCPFSNIGIIESVMRSSFENVSSKDILEKSEVDLDQELMSYFSHGFHAANAESMKLECVWKAMKNTRRKLPKVDSVIGNLNPAMMVKEIRELCTDFAKTSCKVDFQDKLCDPNYEYRSVDGSCNNLYNTRWGAAVQPFERFLLSDYGPIQADGDMDFRKSNEGKELPNPRIISRILSNSRQGDTPKVTLLLMQWGQFIDHDVTLTPERERAAPVGGTKALMCCDRGHFSMSERLGEDCRPIDVTADPYYQRQNKECMRFVRSLPATRGCHFSSMEQVNQITAFVDGSQIYGSENKVADSLRTGRQGLLNTSMHEDNDQPLPPRGGDGTQEPCPIPESQGKCFLAGDVRVDETPSLAAMHTAFIRLHNIIAEGLLVQNPHWKENDEKIYQESRHIVSAIVQQITYRDWLPKVIGMNQMSELDLGTGTFGYKDTYNPSINPTIRNVFSTAAFRFGHTLVPDTIKAATEEMSLPLAGHFFNITVIEGDDTSPSSLLKGYSRCPSEAVDGFVSNTLTDKLFAHEPADDGMFYGLDLVSLNIQRGRDHGLPSYRKWRKFCGLEDVRSFEELRNVMEEKLAKELKHIYDHIDDVDIFVAGLSEFPIEDGLLGPTFSCILARQFAQIKHGDRFWYERKNQPRSFTPDQLGSIRSQGLVSVLCRVSQHTSFGFQPDPFLVPDSSGNNVMDCSSYNFINFQLWKEIQPRKA